MYSVQRLNLNYIKNRFLLIKLYFFCNLTNSSCKNIYNYRASEGI